MRLGSVSQPPSAPPATMSHEVTTTAGNLDDLWGAAPALPRKNKRPQVPENLGPFFSGGGGNRSRFPMGEETRGYLPALSDCAASSWAVSSSTAFLRSSQAFKADATWWSECRLSA